MLKWYNNFNLFVNFCSFSLSLSFSGKGINFSNLIPLCNFHFLFNYQCLYVAFIYRHLHFLNTFAFLFAIGITPTTVVVRERDTYVYAVNVYYLLGQFRASFSSSQEFIFFFLFSAHQENELSAAAIRAAPGDCFSLLAQKYTIHTVAYSFARSLDRGRNRGICATCADSTRLLGIPNGACRQEGRRRSRPLFRRSRKCRDRNDTTENHVKDARTPATIAIDHVRMNKRESK